ncbi:hypothetical protein TPHA_0E00480 [Tetrapisispora phaffii CBS 4417]|uniref:Vacuolar protein-sorting-associated protein 25 n=1 Tax=Tetrapisispora phaffii (strain ATCC 24235 / CBS 4417 / NBRC 1672 / NRRL Y-8282 / UCD 70-5) TaxID=1071381 RepID=G8BTB6_TETPH|nr:hypothetical protein TPHA_0E00480 [Tetrapisispora phaffii CBS 4417]CCE63144.1 hypothetical protein TPHA_0E00480 [Tetrapisispora phaffii CBS 4417]
MSAFDELPKVYYFPPLYTRQVNSLIRRQQIDTWIDLILQYAKSMNCWMMTSEGNLIQTKIDELTGSDSNAIEKKSLFVNETIQRSIPHTFVEEIWTHMVENGKAIRTEHDIESNSVYYIMWKGVDLWSSVILQWFETAVKLNQVVTLYELSQGDETIGWDFHGMPEPLLAKCIKSLCDRQRATIMKDEYGKPVGVKVI